MIDLTIKSVSIPLESIDVKPNPKDDAEELAYQESEFYLCFSRDDVEMDC